MKFIDEFRDAALAQRLARKVASISSKPTRLMEFCGGHTVAIMKYGIRQLLPPNIQMLSGPGCPVCVTSGQDIDRAIALAGLPGVIITTFGDMLKVPGSRLNLQIARAEGCDVRVIYSARDALQVARENPLQPVVLIGIGFETTSPTVAAAILQAEKDGLKNFSVLCLLKMTPPPMKTLLELGEVGLDGIICPGHVSAIIGTQPYEAYARDYGVACVVAGFEPVDILQAVEMLVEQVEKGRPAVEIAYRRGVKPEGNPRALELIEQCFDIAGATWRGLGAIPDSGYRIKQRFKVFDAESNFDVEAAPFEEPKGCLCGQMLRGVSIPTDCKLFGKLCTPENPVGPCMVSSEGSCAAHYQYGDYHG
jgi:hydrogenase expression/formation protein HypD